MMPLGVAPRHMVYWSLMMIMVVVSARYLMGLTTYVIMATQAMILMTLSLMTMIMTMIQLVHVV